MVLLDSFEYDFLLVINCTEGRFAPFPRYSHRYVQRRNIWLLFLRLTPDGGVLHGGQRMSVVPNGVETLRKISTG